MAQITITLDEDGQTSTPFAIGQAIAQALAFGTDDALYTYDEEEPYTLPLVAYADVDEFKNPVPETGITIGTVTLGAAS